MAKGVNRLCKHPHHHIKNQQPRHHPVHLASPPMAMHNGENRAQPMNSPRGMRLSAGPRQQSWIKVRPSSDTGSHAIVDRSSRAATPPANASRKTGLKKEPVGDVSVKTAGILFYTLLIKQSGYAVDECSTESCRKTQEGQSTVSSKLETGPKSLADPPCDLQTRNRTL